jgi:hypothetical protein
MLDPEVVNASNAGVPGDVTATSWSQVTTAGTAFDDAVEEILGVSDPFDLPMKSHVGSATASGLTIKISNGNSVSVYLTSSDPTGKKSTGSTTARIGAGPEVPN